jgi:hypothetical protein
VAVVSMSKQEFSRLDVLLRVQSGHLRVGDACALIGLQPRPSASSSSRARAGDDRGRAPVDRTIYVGGISYKPCP